MKIGIPKRFIPAIWLVVSGAMALAGPAVFVAPFVAFGGVVSAKRLNQTVTFWVAIVATLFLTALAAYLALLISVTGTSTGGSF